VIKAKCDDLNGYQGKKMRWHCRKDLMQNNDINSFKGNFNKTWWWNICEEVMALCPALATKQIENGRRSIWWQVLRTWKITRTKAKGKQGTNKIMWFKN
jgi:hypothetical protein